MRFEIEIPDDVAVQADRVATAVGKTREQFMHDMILPRVIEQVQVYDHERRIQELSAQ